MALKQMIKRQQLAAAQAAAEAHRAARTALDERRTAIETREAEAIQAVEELTAESTQEERAAVEAEADAIDRETQQLDADVAAHDTEQARLDAVVADLEKEISELDARATPPPPASETKPREDRGRKDVNIMIKRRKHFGLDRQERAAFFAGEEVRSFIGAVRESCQNRSVVNGSIGIPTVILELIRENLDAYSKLYAYVNVKQVHGTARQPLQGADIEGIWMEATGELNELDLELNQVTVDGYLVGGFIPVANAYIDDSDINLGAEIIDALARAIGKALDRAILYGTGNKMPVGIATRLAQTSRPDSWDAKAPAWTDLHATNIKKLNINGTTGAAFYAALIEALGVANPKYSNGAAFWVVNRKTHITLMCKALAFDAAAALVAGIKGTMPIIGGDLIELELPGDNEIIGGYGGLYLLAEREGATLESSEHVRFLRNQTVFKGCARYDGTPVRGEGFVLVSYDNTDAATTSIFPEDYANADMGVLGVAAAAGTAVGDTVLTVTGAEASGTTLKYIIGDRNPKRGDKAVGYTALTSGTTQITCAAGKYITVVELDGDGRAIKSGKVVAVPKTA